MKIKFLEIAQVELDDAIEYYNYESPGLGNAFLTEVLNALDRTGEFPEAWHPCSKRTRRCQTRRFPYGIIYQVREHEILIVAVANLHRKWEHYTLQDYLSWLKEAGFLIDTFLEPEPDPSTKQMNPDLYDHALKTPIFFLIKAIRGEVRA